MNHACAYLLLIFLCRLGSISMRLSNTWSSPDWWITSASKPPSANQQRGGSRTSEPCINLRTGCGQSSRNNIAKPLLLNKPTKTWNLITLLFTPKTEGGHGSPPTRFLPSFYFHALITRGEMCTIQTRITTPSLGPSS